MTTDGRGRERCMRWISAGAVLNSCSWTIVTTAQLGMGLQLAPTQEHLVQMTALMRSAAQLSSFFVLPACGALSDWVGRKPVLVARSCIVFLFSGLVALSPSYPVFLLHRFVSNFTHHLTDAMTHAAVADLYQGQQLASATAGLKSQMGLAMLAGPALGGRLAERSFSLCFALSSLCGLANVALFGVGMSETRDETAVGSSQRGAFTKVSPLSFLALFRTRTLAKLTLALGVSEMCDGTTEIDRYYAQEVVGLSLSQNGLYQSLRGGAMIVGGRLVKPLLARLGTQRFTAVANACGAAHMVTKGLSRAPLPFFSALVPHVLGAGSYREAALKAQLMRLALESGMTRAEVTACEANFRALLSISAPFLYSTLYTMTATRPGLTQGAPYFLCVCLLAISQFVFSSIPGENLKLEEE